MKWSTKENEIFSFVLMYQQQLNVLSFKEKRHLNHSRKAFCRFLEWNLIKHLVKLEYLQQVRCVNDLCTDQNILMIFPI